MKPTLYTWAARLLATGVCAIAFVASFHHIRDVALAAGESELVATLIPLSIDGVVLTGILAWLADEANNRRIRPWALLAVWLGVAGTILANLRSASPTLTAYMIAAAPPVALLISTKVLLWEGKPKEQTATPSTSDVLELPEFTQDVIRRVVLAAELARAEPAIEPTDLAQRASVPLRHAQRVISASRNGAASDQAEPALATPAPTETS